MKMDNNLKELTGVVLKKWWLVVLTTILFSGIFYFAGKKLSQTTYESTSSVQLYQQGQTSYYAVQGQLNLVQTYQQLAKSKQVLSPANKKLTSMVKSYNGTASDLKSMVKVGNEPGSLILDFEATSTDAKLSAKAAKAVAGSFVSKFPELAHSNKVNATVVKSVDKDDVTVHPSKAKGIGMMGLIFGFFLGIFVVVISFYHSLLKKA